MYLLRGSFITYFIMKKFRIIIIAFSIIIFTGFGLFSQNSFEVIYSSENSESFSYSFEDYSGNYITMGGRKEIYGQGPSFAVIIKTNSYGNIINEKVFSKPDTSYYFRFGFQKTNGNYFIIATLSDTVTIKKYDVSYFCELTQDFDLVWEKMFTIPQPYINHQMLNFLFDADSNIIIQGKADSSMYSYNDLLFFSKVNLEGDVLQFKLYEGWQDYCRYGVFIHNFDSSGYILMGRFPQNSTAREWVELNHELEITSYVSIIDTEHYISTPISAKWLSNGNLFIADVATMEPGADKDLYVKTMDQGLNIVDDTLILYDDAMYLPQMNGLDFIDENNIWVGQFVGIPTSFSGTEIFRVHIFDSEVNLKGRKEYGGDSRYWFYNLKATSDGGCIITGKIPDYDGSDNSDGYLIKIMPEDILTNAEETPFEFDSDVTVFPNPFYNKLTIETIRKNLIISLFDNTGKKVLTGDIKNIPRTNFKTGNLQAGFYFYTISDNGRIIQSGKLIKSVE